MLSTLSILIVGLAAVAAAAVVAAPEINPASGVNAIALLSGALLVIRSRRR
jgi:hypothetical protein